MSDDELEKLAAAMKNISPSKAARKSGMEAAMAAFDAEFAQETAVQTEMADEKISAPAQGLQTEARPTGQTTYTRYAATLGRDAMSKLKEIFTFKPQAMMMMGTCAAALFATSLYVPNMTFEDNTAAKPAAEAVTAKADTGDVKTAEAGIISDVEVAEVEPDIDIPKPSVVETPTPFAEAVSPAESKSITEEVDIAEALVTAPPVVETPVTALPVTPPETLSAEIPKTGLPSNVVVIERRILKTPASTMERTIPSVTKMETRRVVKTPASTVERSIPAVTKQVSRRVEKTDGTFETVSETVVVTPQSVEYVTVPPTFETVSEPVVVQEASTELVTIPPVYETVRETVMINADGSSEVLSSDVVPSPKAASAGGITSISDLLSSDTADSAIVESEVGSSDADEYRADLAAKDPAALFSELESAEAIISAPDVMPAPEPSVPVDDVVIVTATKVKSSRKSRRAERRRDKKPAPAFAPPPPPPTVAIAEADVAVAPTRTVERVIPAVTKTISRRVVKTPARTTERVIPAITKDVTVRVENGDGTFTDVTKTFVIQEASTELVTIPAIFETVSETVVVTPATVEYIVLNADGTIATPRKIKRPKPKPKPVPQSGLLTAGDYDDVLNPDLYKVYLDKMLQGQLRGKDLPYVDANERVSIRVVDSLGKPVPLADISLKTARGQKMFPLRTGADGMAYLYPNYDSLESGIKVKISAKGARSVTTRLTRKLIKNGGDIVVDLKMESQPVQMLDLLLTIDATGSMGDEMRYLQSELKTIVGRVEASNPGVDIRTGLVVYRDKGDDYIVREIPFTDDIEGFRKSLSAQNANGGGDKPEAMHTAMETGLKMDWRDDALKVNLLVADAPPHDRYLDETWEAGLISRTKGIHIVPLAASGVDKTAEFVMRSMAQITGGRFLFLTDDSGIGNKHAEPTVDCYVVTRLDGLVTRVLSSLIKGERVEPQASDVIRSVGNYRAGTCAIDEQDIPTSIQTVSYKYKQ